MVLLRSGRVLGPVHFREHPSLPIAPPSSGYVILPMRVGRAAFRTPEKYAFFAIVGHTLTCTGRGDTLAEAADDACMKLVDYAEYEYESLQQLSCGAVDGFEFERRLRRETGLTWEPTACQAFVLLDQGKVKSNGWQKRGEDTWRMWTPDFVSLK